jgi:hypothetical protein
MGVINQLTGHTNLMKSTGVHGANWQFHREFPFGTLHYKRTYDTEFIDTYRLLGKDIFIIDEYSYPYTQAEIGYYYIHDLHSGALLRIIDTKLNQYCTLVSHSGADKKQIYVGCWAGSGTPYSLAVYDYNSALKASTTFSSALIQPEIIVHAVKTNALTYLVLTEWSVDYPQGFYPYYPLLQDPPEPNTKTVSVYKSTNGIDFDLMWTLSYTLSSMAEIKYAIQFLINEQGIYAFGCDDVYEYNEEEEEYEKTAASMFVVKYDFDGNEISTITENVPYTSSFFLLMEAFVTEKYFACIYYDNLAALYYARHFDTDLKSISETFKMPYPEEYSGYELLQNTAGLANEQIYLWSRLCNVYTPAADYGYDIRLLGFNVKTGQKKTDMTIDQAGKRGFGAAIVEKASFK